MNETALADFFLVGGTALAYLGMAARQGHDEARKVLGWRKPLKKFPRKRG